MPYVSLLRSDDWPRQIHCPCFEYNSLPNLEQSRQWTYGYNQLLVQGDRPYGDKFRPGRLKDPPSSLVIVGDVSGYPSLLCDYFADSWGGENLKHKVHYRHVNETAVFMFSDMRAEALTIDEVPYDYDNLFWDPEEYD